MLTSWGAPAKLVDAVAAMSFMFHYEWLQRGVIHIRDLVYFGSIVCFMLLATQVVLDNRRGK
jgi:ABC-2 type transport system permease protein